jgi:hypothetical protein
MITLPGGAAADITLENFVWSDQFEWARVAQQIEPALNGAQHIENTLLTVGRPITLISSLEPAALFQKIENHMQSNMSSFVININGANYTVAWLHNPLAVTAKPHKQYSDAQPDNFIDVTLTLITV